MKKKTKILLGIGAVSLTGAVVVPVSTFLSSCSSSTLTTNYNNLLFMYSTTQNASGIVDNNFIPPSDVSKTVNGSNITLTSNNSNLKYFQILLAPIGLNGIFTGLSSDFYTPTMQEIFDMSYIKNISKLVIIKYDITNIDEHPNWHIYQDPTVSGLPVILNSSPVYSSETLNIKGTAETISTKSFQFDFSVTFNVGSSTTINPMN